jgi:catechol 2,3-dioxygenase-like lactoylglutathione lyase family enzyme
MTIGNFSISLTVRDINQSFAFYQKLGFEIFGGDLNQKWLILRNDDCIIGLFEGMFDKNMLTFNPGWNRNKEEVNPFTDIRILQEQLKEKGIKFLSEVDTTTKGPGSFMVMDPDGNPILIDQHR